MGFHVNLGECISIGRFENIMGLIQQPQSIHNAYPDPQRDLKIRSPRTIRETI